MDKDTMEALSVRYTRCVILVPLSNGNWAIFDNGRELKEIVPHGRLSITLLKYARKFHKEFTPNHD